MKKLLLVLAMVGGVSPSFAQSADIWSPGYVWNAAANRGSDVWFGPGNKVTLAAIDRGSVIAKTANGMEVSESKPVALRDGRSVALAAKRFVSVAELLKGVASVAGGPYGIAAAIALPFFVEWVAGDNAEHIRISDGKLEKKDPDACTSQCVNYFIGTSARGKTPVLACTYWIELQPTYKLIGVITQSAASNQYDCSYTVGTSPSTYQRRLNVESVSPDTEPWLPASMDDIAPYMTPRVPAVSAIAALTSLGIELASSPVSVTGPSPALAPLPPHVQTTQYPAPTPTTSNETVPGNPFGLAPNTPTVTSSSTGTRPISPGSTISTGPSPTPAPATPGPINSPTSTTTTSTYNPTTNQTTNTTNTTVAPQTQTVTTTTTTNITNTTNTSNVTNNTTTTTTIINNLTNEETVKTDTKDDESLDPTPTDCEKNPSSLGCAEFGTPENPTLPKSAIPILVTPKVFAGSGSCPAPLSFSVLGQSYQVAYTPLCDQLVYLKALMLALAGIMAAYILADSFKV